MVLLKKYLQSVIPVTGTEHMELVGGHNYCRNPAPEEMDEPWCFIDDSNEKQVGGDHQKINKHAVA